MLRLAPVLQGCQSQGNKVEETLTNIGAAIELFPETLTEEEPISEMWRARE